jgi:hypothetical protein
VGFSLKLAPGVRIRASSRGLRASVGPRIARAHFGGGSAGVSTGFGPVAFYASLGGGRSGGSRGSGAPTPSVASYQREFVAHQRQSAKGQKAERVRNLANSFLAILNLHRAEFAPASQPVLPPPAPPDRNAIYEHYERKALEGVGKFRVGARKEARRAAASWTESEAQRQAAAAIQQHAGWQQYYDERWRRLCANVPETVIETLEEAFEDNEAPSAAVGVHDNEISLVVLVPPMDDAVPYYWPSITQAGNPSLRKMTQRERSDYYKILVCGHTLVTVREALAVAPGLRSARIAALRNDGPDAYGRPRTSCLLAAKFERSSFDRVQWATADAPTIVNGVSSQLVTNQRGRSKDLAPIDLAEEPELEQLIRAVDLSQLVGDSG